MLGRLQPGRTKPATAAHDAGSSRYLGPSPGYPLAAPVTGARCWRGALSWCSAGRSANRDRRRATRCSARSPLVPGNTGGLALLVRGQAARTVEVLAAQSTRAPGLCAVGHGAGLVPLARCGWQRADAGAAVGQLQFAGWQRCEGRVSSGHLVRSCGSGTTKKPSMHSSHR